MQFREKFSFYEYFSNISIFDTGFLFQAMTFSPSGLIFLKPLLHNLLAVGLI